MQIHKHRKQGNLAITLYSKNKEELIEEIIKLREENRVLWSLSGKENLKKTNLLKPIRFKSNV